MMLGKLYFTPAGKNTKSYLLTNEITEYYTGTVYMYDTKKVKGTWTTKVSKTKPVNPQIAKIKNKLDKAELNLAEAKQAISSDANALFSATELIIILQAKPTMALLLIFKKEIIYHFTKQMQ